MNKRLCYVPSLEVLLLGISNKLTFLSRLLLISDKTLLWGHLAFSQGWPLNRSLVVICFEITLSLTFVIILFSAPDFKTVQLEVSKLLKGRILVGHALRNDLAVRHAMCLS